MYHLAASSGTLFPFEVKAQRITLNFTFTYTYTLLRLQQILTAVSQPSIWMEYAQMEIEQNDTYRLEQIFAQSLWQVPSVELWSMYLDYVRRTQPLVNDQDGRRRDIVAQGFDAVMEQVGIDPGRWEAVA